MKRNAKSIGKYGTGAYYHISGVWNCGTGTATLYVNSLQDGSTTFSPDSSINKYNQVPYRIGVGKPEPTTVRRPADGSTV